MLEQVREAVGDDCAITARLCDRHAQRQPARDPRGRGGLRLHRSSPTTWSTSGTSRPAAGSRPNGPARTPVASRFAGEFCHREYIEAVRAATDEADRRGRALHEPRHDGRGGPLGRDRHHRRRPPVDRRSRSCRRRSKRAATTRSASASAATSAPRASRRAAPIVCTQNATVGEEYRRGWHPGAVRDGRQRREDGARRRRRAGRDGVRDGARQARA